MSVVVIGAGQAGLSVSHELTALGRDHVVLERGRVGNTWRGRWSSFCLVTPNWSVQLPGGAYDGADPDGYMPRDDIVGHLERYARSFDAPVRENVAVRALERDGTGFILHTSDGDIRAESVVIATGAYQRPHRPSGAESLPTSLQTIDVEQYRDPSVLASGTVVVVGSGQTGCQIAEELREAGRDVVLACGKAPWGHRRLEGRDVVRWLFDAGFFDQTRATLPGPAARLSANIQASGHHGGRDLHYRTLQAADVTLVGHFRGVEGGRLRFAPDLGESVAWGDARYDDIRKVLRGSCERGGIPTPEMPDPEPFVAAERESIDLDGVGAVIFTSGFRPDYTSWVRIPGAFDAMGFPVESDGASTVAPGLYFCGVHFMRKRKSSLLMGVGEDAGIVARAIAARPVAPSRAAPGAVS